jgi:hypothetical protein
MLGTRRVMPTSVPDLNCLNCWNKLACISRTGTQHEVVVAGGQVTRPVIPTSRVRAHATKS